MREKLIVIREVPEIGRRSVVVVTPKRLECSNFWDGVQSPKTWRIKPSSSEVFVTVGVHVQDITLVADRHWSAGRLAAFIMPDDRKGGAK
jgi:hypothetical protein